VTWERPHSDEGAAPPTPGGIVLRPIVPADFVDTSPAGGRDKYGMFNSLVVHPSSGLITLGLKTTGIVADGTREMMHLRLVAPPEWVGDGTRELVAVLDQITLPGQPDWLVGFSGCDRDVDTLNVQMGGVGAGLITISSGGLGAAAWSETSESRDSTATQPADDPVVVAKVTPFGPIGNASSTGSRLAMPGVGTSRVADRSPASMVGNIARGSFQKSVTDQYVFTLCAGYNSSLTIGGTISFRARWGVSPDLDSASIYSPGG